MSSDIVLIMDKSGRVKIRRAVVTEDHKAESARLLAIWNSKKHGSQAEFGELFQIGSQSAVAQFLSGKAPISLKAARGFAKGLGCKIGDFSPRLDQEAQASGELSQLLDFTGAGTDLARRMSSADEATRQLIEIALLETDEEAVQQLTPSLVSLVRTMKAMLREQALARKA